MLLHHTLMLLDGAAAATLASCSVLRACAGLLVVLTAEQPPASETLKEATSLLSCSGAKGEGTQEAGNPMAAPGRAAAAKPPPDVEGTLPPADLRGAPAGGGGGADAQGWSAEGEAFPLVCTCVWCPEDMHVLTI